MERSYSNTVSNTFYQNLGNLFYAVAIVDGAVHIKEIDKLKSLIRKYWLSLDEAKDEYGADAAFQIEITFDRLLENEKKSAESFTEFVTFYKSNQTLFTDAIKMLIFDTANAIANAFSGKNKSELVILGKLQLLFQSEH